MNFHDEKDGDRRRKSDSPTGGETGQKTRKKRVATPEVGNALRSIYDRTVNESIPPEMLDLLGKLG